MLGYLFNTLNRRVNAEAREWQSVNRAHEKFRPGKMYRFLLMLSARPRAWTITLFAVASVFVVGFYIVDPRYWTIRYIDKFDVADRAAYFSALWSIQTGLVALLYPIVIAFVTLLLSRQQSTSAALPIYLHDSAAQFSGSSALALVVQMGVQYIWIPYVNDTTLMNWILVDAIWFLINAALTLYFLARTYQFVKPARRFDVTKRYLVNVSWPREAHRHLASHFWQAAVGEGLLPGPAFDAKTATPSVMLGVAGIDSKHRLNRSFPHARQLADIRFRLLGWAIKSWLRRARKVPQPAGRANPFASVISFPLNPFSVYEGATSLCLLDGNVQLSRYERRLIQCAFVFRRPPKELVIDVKSSDILSDAQAEANEALRNDDSELFQEQVGRLLELYDALIAASEVLDDTGKRTSLLLLSQSTGFFGERLVRVVNSGVIQLFDAAAQKLSARVDYVRAVSYLPNRLFASAAKGNVLDLMKEFLELSPIFYFAVARWWRATVEIEGHAQHGICSGVVLKPPARGRHDDALRQFVQAWESLRRQMAPRKAQEWKELAATGPCLERHLFHTVALLSTATVRGDRLGAESLVDVLVRWYGDVRIWFAQHANDLWRPYFVTYALFGDDWAVVQGRLGELTATLIAEPTPMGVFRSALKNLWRDLCCITIFIHLLWGKQCECESSLATVVVRALTSGRALRGCEHDAVKPYANADELLIAILRQRYADARYTEYLNTCIEKFLDLAQPEPIPGRIYSRYGAWDLDYLSEAQLLALMLVCARNWTPGAEIRGLLQGWTGKRDNELRDLQGLLGKWSGLLKSDEFASRKAQYDCLRVEGSPEFDEHRVDLAGRLDSWQQELAARYEQAVAEADISAERLLAFGHWASALAFAKATANFPISAFRTVGIVDQAEHVAAVLNSVSINRMRRGEFTDPVREPVAVNEEEWIAKVVRDHAAAIVLWNLLRELAPVDVLANSAETYWIAFKQYASDAQEKGLHPILLLENPTIPEWVYEWGNTRFGRPTAELPSDLSVVKKQRPDLKGYQFDLNGVPVISAPLPPGASILLILESLVSVDFVRRDDGRFVTATVDPTPDEQNLVDLKLSWHARARIDTTHRAVRLVYTNKRPAEP